MTPELRKIWDNPKKLRLETLSHLDEQDEQDMLALEKAQTPVDRIAFLIAKAAKADNVMGISELVRENPPYAHFAFERWRKKGKRGQSNNPKKSDLPAWLRQRLSFALQDLQRIRRFWKAKFKKSYGKQAIEIASERWGVEPSQLENYRKTTPKKRRP